MIAALEEVWSIFGVPGVIGVTALVTYVGVLVILCFVLADD